MRIKSTKINGELFLLSLSLRLRR